ncbi:hypothetical protein L1049_000821 [Liquidambar formosana]|uniref:Uncharacterized protein n=1 Tax=Liquidambar formosana TaxID=63359 RepID=A0AAP0R5M9_LIQFO
MAQHLMYCYRFGSVDFESLRKKPYSCKVSPVKATSSCSRKIIKKEKELVIAQQVLSCFIISYLYELLIPKRWTKAKRRHTVLVRIGVGMACSILCCIAACLVEVHRLKLIKMKNLQNNTDEPISMSVFCWFGQTINSSHLDKYYTMLAALSLGNLCFYYIVSTCIFAQNEAQRVEVELIGISVVDAIENVLSTKTDQSFSRSMIWPYRLRSLYRRSSRKVVV